MSQAKRTKNFHPEGQIQYQPPPICLMCRWEFDSNNQLHDHIRTTCWASISERKYPKEWRLALIYYVRRALDPVNAEPGWCASDIITTLQCMIDVSATSAEHGANWETMDLPQHIDPKKLPYDRLRGLPRIIWPDESVQIDLTARKLYLDIFRSAASLAPSGILENDGRESVQIVSSVKRQYQEFSGT